MTSETSSSPQSTYYVLLHTPRYPYTLLFFPPFFFFRLSRETFPPKYHIAPTYIPPPMEAVGWGEILTPEWHNSEADPCSDQNPKPKLLLFFSYVDFVLIPIPRYCLRRFSRCQVLVASFSNQNLCEVWVRPKVEPKVGPPFNSAIAFRGQGAKLRPRKCEKQSTRQPN